MFLRIQALQHPAERLNAFISVNFKLPKSKAALDKLLHQPPKEGDFWQADHIVAVAEGGGGCGLENLRTLCTPCHRVETEQLRSRLRLSGGGGEHLSGRDDETKGGGGGGVGQMDIRQAFFGLKKNPDESVSNMTNKQRKRSR